MDTHAALIETIAIGLTAAFVGGFIARRLGLPAIVGYLLAGVAVGPFTPGLVADQGTVAELAELGVILLMFGVGIHFSIDDLLAVKGTTVPGAIAHIAVATVLGACLGIALGWGLAGGLVLGLSISVASTVVLLRSLTDRGELDSQHGRITVGWLIVEDLFTVLVLVLLPTIAPLVQNRPDDLLGPILEIGAALAKAVLFAAIMLYAGSRIVPAVLAAVARERSRELFTLSVLAIAIGIGFVAAAVFGVSYALGAFLAGAVLSRTDLSYQAAADALPLRDAFAVLFFVSVGMLLDPAYLVQEPWAVLAVTAVVVVAKSVSAFGIGVGLGYRVRTGLTVSAALSQIGEFSFILATLGVTLGLLPDAAFQLIVAGSIVSIALNPFVFRLVEPLEAWIRARPRLLAVVERHDPQLAVLEAGGEGLERHAVVCGYGRVGRMVASALERRGFRYVVISDDRHEVERLRERGVPSLFGDAANAELLVAAHLDRAKVLIVAMSDAPSARLTVDRSRDVAPNVPVVVRTHSGREAATLRALGDKVQPVHAEREVAIQMARFSLRRFGVSSAEVDAIASGLRERGAGDQGRRTAGPVAPWLRRAVARARRRLGRTTEGDPGRVDASRPETADGQVAER